MSPEDISENVGEPHQAPLLEFVNLITLVSPNWKWWVKSSCKDLCLQQRDIPEKGIN